MKRLVMIVALVATPATAQTTNCRWMGNIWTCNTQQPPAPSRGIDWRVLQDAHRQGQEDRARQDALQQQHFQQQQEQFDRTARDILRRAVANDLANGNCASAQNRALTAGDIEMAGQVRQFCAAKPAP